MPSKLAGILNVTPDSFSDGGESFLPEDAITQAEQLIADGADVIDIGAESTRPGATPLTSTQEWERLAPVLERLIGKATISIDTRHPETAKKALAMGADWINDVSGLADPAMAEVLANYPQSYYVLMHSLSVPADPNQILPEEQDVVQAILHFARQKLEYLAEQGIAKERTIFDPGIGFGKNAQQSLELIERIEEFKTLGVPLFVGHSRKSFLAKFSNTLAADRDALTLEFSKKLSACGVDYLRVHNVKLHHHGL
jgi:dihydropteroate synthase